MELKTRYATYKDCYLIVDRYVADMTPAITVWNNEDGPIIRLTTCLELNRSPLYGKFSDDAAFADTNNFPEVLDFIREYNLGKVTGAAAWSGFCRYPLVEFDMQELMKYAG